ncbi:helix-turn-helix domain-containing protein [Lentibacillus salinarum]|uniref:RodZ domain-containing protein n=1 Tax=Lentibacillus salinarum TaxID=446820 RepID=A0ABW3ZPW7_9BACI
MAIGEKLKEAREDQNLSLETLQETTKIQKRYLEAIEQGNFKILPGTFYARAFIKEYATAVGLDPNELLEEYKAELPQEEEDRTTHYSHIHRSRKDNNPSKSTAVFSFIPTIIVVLLVIGIIFVVWFFTQGSSTEESSETVEPQSGNEVFRDPENDESDAGDEAESDTEAEDANEDNMDSKEEEPADSEPVLNVEEAGTGSPPESTLTLENASDDVQVTIEAKDDSWLDVENGDGDVLFSDVATADDSPIELDVSKLDRVWLNIGSTPALDITIDGVELDYPVDPDNEVFQKIWININKASEQTN